LTLGRRILELGINLPDENFGRHSQVGKTAYTVVDKIQDSKKTLKQLILKIFNVLRNLLRSCNKYNSSTRFHLTV